MSDRLDRFKRLQVLRKRSQKDNRKDLYKEYKRNRLNTTINTDTQSLVDDKKSKAIVDSLKNSNGEVIKEKLKKKELWNYSVEDSERWENKKLKNPNDNDIKENNGGDDFDTVAKNTYLKQVTLIKSERMKSDALVTTAKVSLNSDENGNYKYDHVPSKEDISLLVKTLKNSEKNKQSRIAKTKVKNEISSSKSAYINVKNKEFNEKLSRQYDKYTKSLRDNLEKSPF